MQMSEVKLCPLLFTERWNSAQSLARDCPMLGLLYSRDYGGYRGTRRGGFHNPSLRTRLNSIARTGELEKTPAKHDKVAGKGSEDRQSLFYIADY